MLGSIVAMCAFAALFSNASAAVASSEIHGKVTDHLGDPIAGITVCAEGLTMFVGSECDWTTDAEGKYSIAGLEAASYRIGFHVERNPGLNYVPQWYSGKAHPDEADPVTLAEGESREVNAQMATGGEITGRVADVETDLPIEGVEVCADLIGFFQTGEVGYCGRTDAAGQFTVKNLGTGQYRLEFRTEGDVNYVEEAMPEAPSSIPVTAGGAIDVETHLVPGIQIEGTLTEAGTGAPVEGFPAPHSVPAVCALDSATEARVKCASVRSGGHYSIAGLPTGTYAIAFALDWVEEGLDLHPDGYLRRYWQEVPSFEEATLLAGAAGTVFDGIDAVLTPGEEVFPHCEVSTACPSSPSSGGPSPGDVSSPAIQPPPVPRATRPHCRKGSHRVFKSGHARCVKVAKKHSRHRQPRKTA